MDFDSDKRSKRFQQKKRHIERQVVIMKDRGLKDMLPEQSHRYHKVHALNCGNSNCVMCGNPRKMFGHKTMQERKFEASAVDEE